MNDLISRQAAIDALETVKTVKAENGELYIAKINAQMKLEILPSAQPDTTTDGSNVVKKGGNDEDRTSGDCISRQMTIVAIEQHGTAVLEGHKWDEGIEYGYAAAHRHLVDIIEQLPSALPSIQPERKKGTWTKDASCPLCGFQPWYEKDIHTLSFCPNCGADMRGERDE